MRTILVAACLALALSGCGRGDVAAPPPSLLVPCAEPVAIPARDLTGVDVEVLWGRDRSALRACASRQAALAWWVAAKPPAR